MKLVRIRPRADADIDSLADYIAEENPGAALRFLSAVEKTFAALARQPGMGSPRFAHLPLLEGLRVWAVSGFENHLIFYIERSAYIDVLRVLHAARDIPAALRESPAGF